MPYKVPRPDENLAERAYVPAIVAGLGITLRKFFRNVVSRKDTATIFYEGDGKVTMPYPARYRGLHRLTRREDGSPRCVACLCCSTACPAQCIFIRPGEYPDGDPRFGWERYPVEFVIDEMRCIFCGYCVEACPCDAIRMDTGIHVPPVWNRADLVYDKERLLSHTAKDGNAIHANPRQEPPEPSSYQHSESEPAPRIDRGAAIRT